MKANFCLLLLGLFSVILHGQPQAGSLQTAFKRSGGKYHIQSFDQLHRMPSFFETNYYSISESNDGMIWVGTEEKGIMMYNGNRWLFGGGFSLAPVYAIARENQKMFFGGNNEFGWGDINTLSQYFLNADGHYAYHSLIEQLPPEEHSFGSIDRILPIKGTVFFASKTHLFHYQNDHLQLILKDSLPFRLTSFQDQPWLWRTGKGLFHWSNSTWQLVPEGQLLAEVEVQQMLELDSNQLLITTSKDELFVFTEGKLIPFSTIASDYLKTHHIKAIELLFDQSIALGTQTGGIVVLNQRGEWLELFNQNNGLPDREINNLFVDASQNLWVAMEGIISRIEYPSLISWFDGDSGIKGSIWTITEFEKQLYVGTSRGLYTRPLDAPLLSINNAAANFVKIEGVGPNCRSLFATENGLMIAGEGGVFEWKKGQVTQKSENAARILYRSKRQPNVIYVGLEDGLARMEKRDTDWHYIGQIAGPQGQINNMVEDQQERLWLGMNNGYYKMPLNIQDSTQYYFSIKKGEIGSKRGRYFMGKINVLLSKGVPIFQNESQGTWVYDKNGDSLKKSSIPFPQVINKDFSEGFITFTHFNNAGEFYFSNFDNGPEENLVLMLNSDGDTLYQANKDYRWSKEIRRNGGFDIMYYASDSSIYFGLPNGQLCHYDGRMGKPQRPPYRAFITSVNFDDSQDDKIDFSSPKTALNSYGIIKDTCHTVLEYRYNSIQIHCSTVGSFVNYEDHFEYKLHLIGEEGEWNSLAGTNSLTFTNLSEGHYMFQVKASNFGNVSEVDTFSFIILPPWYRTVWAYLAYGLLLLGLIVAVSQWRTRRIRKVKEQLEAIVLERTAEVWKQNETLRAQKTKIEVLLKELNHRVKNNLQTISSLLSSQSRRLEAGTAKAAVQASQRRVQAIALIHENLYKGSHPMEVDMSVYIKELVKTIYASFDFESGKVALDIDIPNILLNVDKAIPIGLIVNECVTNSFKYAFHNRDNPRLKLTLRQEASGMLYLEIRDNGKGLPKGFNWNHSNTFGLKLIKGLSKQINADLNFLNGVGTGYELIFQEEDQLEQ